MVIIGDFSDDLSVHLRFQRCTMKNFNRSTTLYDSGKYTGIFFLDRDQNSNSPDLK